MSAEISPETVKAFEKYDKDGSGSIDKAELEAVLAEMGYPCEPSTIDSLLANFSTVGTLNLEQFDGVTRMLHLARKMELSKAPLDPKAQAAFNRLDTDGSGDISCAELHVLLRELEMDLDLDYARRLVHHYKNWPVGAHKPDDAALTLAEFTALYNDLSAGTTTVTKPDVEPDILRCFREFDADANGEIDLHELGTILESMGLKLDPTALANLIENFSQGTSVLNAYQLQGVVQFTRLAARQTQAQGTREERQAGSTAMPAFS